MKSMLNEQFEKTLEMLLPLGTFLIILAAGYLLRSYLLSRLSRWVRKTDSRAGNAILSAVRAPFIVLCVMLGVAAALGVSNLPKPLVEKADTGLSILATIAVTMVTANILCAFTRIRAERIESVLPVTSLTENIIRIVVYGVGALIVLNSIGISSRRSWRPSAWEVWPLPLPSKTRFRTSLRDFIS